MGLMILSYWINVICLNFDFALFFSLNLWFVIEFPLEQVLAWVVVGLVGIDVEYLVEGIDNIAVSVRLLKLIFGPVLFEDLKFPIESTIV